LTGTEMKVPTRNNSNKDYRKTARRNVWKGGYHHKNARGDPSTLREHNKAPGTKMDGQGMG